MTLTLQILIAAIIVSLSIMVLVVGIQIFQILFEFRLSLKKLNRILDHTHSLSQSASRPVAAVSDFFTDVQSLVNETENEIADDLPDKVISAAGSRPEQFHKRFFHRSGLPLRAS